MKCLVCHGESIEARAVKEPIEVGSDVLYVTVTIPVCQTCGERSGPQAWEESRAH